MRQIQILLMRAISYSLFGIDREKDPNCFDFDCYCRGLVINIRFNRILYPNWINVLNVDQATYQSKYGRIFNWFQNKGLLRIDIQNNNTPLTLAMLWRFKTVFSYTHPEWDFTHVLCRDIDSVATYREAQAVQQWIEEGKTAHCITDSISHNIPMMGGMIGFKPGDLSSRLGMNKYEDVIGMSSGINFARKGADQDFLNRYIYPKVAESVTEHFVLGMPHNLAEVNGRHYSIPDVPVEGVPEVYKITNTCAGHIGAAGFYETPTIKFLRHHDPYEKEYAEIEKAFPQLFFWRG